MSIVIVPDFVAEDHEIRSKLHLAAKYITVHETANPNRGADDIMHGKYIKTPAAIDRSVLWHFTVDHDSIRQHIPVDEVGWHAGDGYNGAGNRQSIAIEMCVNEDGDFQKTQENTAQLIAHLYAIVPTLLSFPDGVVQHNKWSGKDCPKTLRSNGGAGWTKFLKAVKLALTPEWNPTDEINKLVARGIINTNHNANALVDWGKFATVINRVLDKWER